jgi:peptidoglycan/xylan/chitin deacetylase (PgdA/CDA1 family)
MLKAVRERVSGFLYDRFWARKALWPGKQAVVSFSFDDFPRSAYQVGGSILEEFGVRGTYYVTLGVMNQGNRFTESDLREVVAAGHEIGCHTFDHCTCSTVSPSRFVASIEQNALTLQQLLQGPRFTSFSFPRGDYTYAALRQIGQLFPCARSIDPGINAGLVDLNRLQANALYAGADSTEKRAKFRSLIETAAASRGWLHFYTHDVACDPSRVGCTPDVFRETVQCCLDHGMTVLPVFEALQIIAQVPAVTVS